MAEEIWVVTKAIDTVSDPHWDTSSTIIGTPERIRSLFGGVIPFGWRLLKNKQARRFLEWSLKQEARWQREQEARRRYGGSN
jgi:hypothetical protein